MDRRKKRITWIDRLQIEKLFNAGASYRRVAKVAGFAVSSIYAEVQRGLYDHLDSATWETVKHYSAQIADDDAKWQATAKGCPIKLDKHHDYAQSIAARILSGESPDQIVGDLKRQGRWTVSTVTLYRYIDQGFIPGVTNKALPVKSRRKKRTYNKVRAAKPPKGVSIERRPSHIAARQFPGHWEMDTLSARQKERVRRSLFSQNA